ncbi:hypothetical protein CF326_g8952 [Tilletia indica]|nr:hypothetical protein CF326_g8952 [Tilletia indica]
MLGPRFMALTARLRRLGSDVGDAGGDDAWVDGDAVADAAQADAEADAEVWLELFEMDAMAGDVIGGSGEANR